MSVSPTVQLARAAVRQRVRDGMPQGYKPNRKRRDSEGGEEAVSAWWAGFAWGLATTHR